MTVVVVVSALVAGALGALLRYGVTVPFRNSPARLPWAVLIVNVVGSLVAGIAVALSLADPHGALRLIVVSGFAGGLTTFSTFSVEAVQLVIGGRWRALIGSVLGNLLGGTAAFVLAFTTVLVLDLSRAAAATDSANARADHPMRPAPRAWSRRAPWKAHGPVRPRRPAQPRAERHARPRSAANDVTRR